MPPNRNVIDQDTGPSEQTWNSKDARPAVSLRLTSVPAPMARRTPTSLETDDSDAVIARGRTNLLIDS
jgi:hypothetical protein